MATWGLMAALASAIVGCAADRPGGGPTADWGGRPLLGARGGPAGTPSAARSLGPTAPSTPVDFSLVLSYAHPAALRRSLREVNDPRSPSFGHFLSARAFGARFGLSSAVLARLERRLRRAGVTVKTSYPQRTALEVRATAATIKALFGVSLIDYQAPGGQHYHAPRGAPLVPPALAKGISAVAGLSTRPVIRPADVPAGGLTPSGAAQAYDTAPLLRMGISGQGQKIAVVSLDSFTDSDPALFAQHFGITGPAPVHVPVLAPVTPGQNADEVNLDIDTIRSVAPQAQVLDYEIPGNVGDAIGQAVDRIVRDGLVRIVSVSWVGCEQLEPPSDVRRTQASLAAASLQGITVLVASGDTGAYDCQQKGQFPNDLRLTVGFPSSSPNAISVGGTTLAVGQDGSYLSESGWEVAFERGGGGGGLSSLFARPAWQAGVLGVQNSYSNGRRQMPDVSANADSNTGWPVAIGGQLKQFGGTSAATPFWAGSLLLAAQYAQSQGVRSLPPVDPMLYRLAATPQPFPPFHDVTTGGNLYYQATPGWDYSTGLGSPDVFNLARDIVAFVRGGGR